METEIIVGLLSLLGLVLAALMQREVRHSEAKVNEAEAMESSAGAVSQITEALMKAVEALASRDALIADLRTRIEALEYQDRVKTTRINELERTLRQVITERDELAARLQEHEASPSSV